LELTILSFICDFPLRILLLFLAFNMEQYNTIINGENRSTGSAKCQNHINMQRWRYYSNRGFCDPWLCTMALFRCRQSKSENSYRKGNVVGSQWLLGCNAESVGE
jgi:hypothetical protein